MIAIYTAFWESKCKIKIRFYDDLKFETILKGFWKDSRTKPAL